MQQKTWLQSPRFWAFVAQGETWRRTAPNCSGTKRHQPISLSAGARSYDGCSCICMHRGSYEHHARYPKTSAWCCLLSFAIASLRTLSLCSTPYAHPRTTFPSCAIILRCLITSFFCIPCASTPTPPVAPCSTSRSFPVHSCRPKHRQLTQPPWSSLRIKSTSVRKRSASRPTVSAPLTGSDGDLTLPRGNGPQVRLHRGASCDLTNTLQCARTTRK
jgi:hypothetical protein